MRLGCYECRDYRAAIHDGEDEGYGECRRRAIRTGVCQRLSKRQCAATLPAFRDVLIAMARSARGAK
jgi:hypothetical protein